MRRTLLIVIVALMAVSASWADDPKPDKAAIAALVKQLGDGDYAKREAAQEALIKIGRPALEALHTAAKSIDAEVAWRAQALVKAIDGKFVTLEFDDRPYIIGQSIPVHWRFENVLPSPMTIDMGGDYRGTGRHERFRIIATDKQGKQVADPIIQPMNMGGIGGPRELAAGEVFYQTLDLATYLLFEDAGEYRITITHDLGWKKGDGPEPPTAQMTLRIAEPTAAQVPRVLAELKAMPKSANYTSGEKGKVRRNYSVLRHPLYLPALKKLADEGSIDAVTGIGSIRTPEATEALLDVLLATDDAKLRQQAWRCMRYPARFPDPQYQRPDDEQMHRYYQPQRQYAERVWRPELRPKLHDLSMRWLTQPDGNVGQGGYILKCIGVPEDLPDVTNAITQLLQRTEGQLNDDRALLRAWQEHLWGLLAGARAAVDKGAEVPVAPDSDGALLVWVDHLKREAAFRPAGWPKHLERALHGTHPLALVETLSKLPDDVPVELLADLPKWIDHPLGPVVNQALVVAAKHPSPACVEPITRSFKHAIATHYVNQYSVVAAAEANGIALDQRVEILLSLLDGKEGGKAMLWIMEQVVESNGWSSRSDVPQEEREEVKQMWQAFVAVHREQLRQGKKFKPGDEALSPLLFPTGFAAYDNDKPWPRPSDKRRAQ